MYICAYIYIYVCVYTNVRECAHTELSHRLADIKTAMALSFGRPGESMRDMLDSFQRHLQEEGARLQNECDEWDAAMEAECQVVQELKREPQVQEDADDSSSMEGSEDATFPVASGCVLPPLVFVHPHAESCWITPPNSASSSLRGTAADIMDSPSLAALGTPLPLLPRVVVEDWY